MKKSLLLLSSALLVASSAFGAVAKDPTNYPAKAGLTCSNLWLMDRGHDEANYLASPMGQLSGKYRTATLVGDVLYIASSKNWDPAAVDEKGNLIDCAGFEKYALETGEYLGFLPAKLEDGSSINGLLAGNSCGVDSFGHLWIAPYAASNSFPYRVYSVNPETGAAVLEAELTATNNGRIDYCDVIGDITCTDAQCVIMAAAAPPAADATTYRWMCDQGSKTAPTDFYGGWDGGDDSYVITELYPAKAIQWSYAPVAKIVLGADPETAYNADLFYIDGFQSAPTLYDATGTIVDSFANAEDCCPENMGVNGVAEFSLGERNFIIYGNNQHTGKNGGNEIWVSELGEGMTFSGMTQLWRLPETGMNPNLISDGGTRVHSLNVKKVTDDAGKQGVYLSTYKCNAGVGTYFIAEEGFNGAGVEENVVNAAEIVVANGLVTVSEEAAEIAVYNVAGQLVNKVNNANQVELTEAGAYIVKATVNGTTLVKKVIL